MNTTVKRAIIWGLIGLALAIALLITGLFPKDGAFFIILFFPVYFLGLGFCKWSLIGKIFLGIIGFQFINRWDRFHILSSLAGGLVFSYIIVIGWIVGLFKFGISMVREGKEGVA